MLPIGAFSFSGGSVSSGQVLVLTLFQIVPEAPLDYYCTFTEVNNGLSKPHNSYWSLRTGAKNGGVFGDLVKAGVTKIFLGGCLIALVLMASME